MMQNYCTAVMTSLLSKRWNERLMASAAFSRPCHVAPKARTLRARVFHTETSRRRIAFNPTFQPLHRIARCPSIIPLYFNCDLELRPNCDAFCLQSLPFPGLGHRLFSETSRGTLYLTIPTYRHIVTVPPKWLSLLDLVFIRLPIAMYAPFYFHLPNF
jgi:hypothetical protein